LYAKDVRNIAPALVITAEYDPLADEGAAYAERLQEAGVPVEFTCYRGMIHGFMMMPRIVSPARAAIRQLTEALRKAFLTR
jgi:acetyl esterase